MRAGPRHVLGFYLFLYFRHPSISDENQIAVLVETTRDHATATVTSGLMVFSVLLQRACHQCS